MDLIIVAAGNGSRFTDENGTIKPLAEVNGVPNIFNTVMTIGHHFDRIIITINQKHEDLFANALARMFDQYPDDQAISIAENLDKIVIHPITTGLGSGHAVMESLDSLKRRSLSESKSNKNVIVTWGDAVFHNDGIIKELTQYDPVAMVLPVAKEINPYLGVILDENCKCYGIEFNVEGEGYHDQSVFMLNIKRMSDILAKYHELTWYGKCYDSSNGEFGFLFILKYMAENMIYASAFETRFPTRSYNNTAELEKIRKELFNITEVKKQLDKLGKPKRTFTATEIINHINELDNNGI